MIIAGTGHRLGRRLIDGWAPTGYENNLDEDLLKLARGALKHYDPELVISGGAIGWDMALGFAATGLGISLQLALPFHNFWKRWPERQQQRIQWLMRAVTVMKDAGRPGAVCNVIAQGKPVLDAYYERSTWMVTHCTLLLALWDGRPGGGTAHTIQVAESQGITVRNLWSSWQGGRMKKTG